MDQQTAYSASATTGLPKVSWLLVQSLIFYKKYFWKLVCIEIIPFLVMGVAFLLAAILKNSIAALIVYLLGVLLLILAQLAVVLLVKFNEPKVGIFKSYRMALQRFHHFIWLDIANAVITFSIAIIIGSITGFIALVQGKLALPSYLPAILLGIIVIIGILIYLDYIIRFSLAMYVFADQDVRGSSAMLVSKDYVKGYFSAYMNRFFVVLILAAAVSFVLGLIGRINVQLSSAVSAVYSLLLVPFISIYFFNLYLSLKALKSDYQPAVTGKRRLKLWSVVILAIAAVIGWYIYLGGSIGYDLVKYMLFKRLQPPAAIQQTSTQVQNYSLPPLQTNPKALPDNYR